MQQIVLIYTKTYSLQIVKLEFLTLNVEQSATCAYDKVTVYDGVDNSATRLGRYCGTTLPGEVISTTNSLFVSFQSDSSVTKVGFNIKYTASLGGKSHFVRGIFYFIFIGIYAPVWMSRPISIMGVGHYLRKSVRALYKSYLDIRWLLCFH